MQNGYTISIIGTGAVGGLYGALLQHKHHNVHFLVNRDYDHVREHGLQVESPLGNVTLKKVNAHKSASTMPKSDLIIVALKTTHNSILKTALPHMLTDESIVLTLQNGLGCDDEIFTFTTTENILGGLCFLCSNKIGPGHIRHLDYGLITLGEYRSNRHAGGITKRLEDVGALFEAAHIPIQLIEDLSHARWKKLVWNIPFNGLSVIRNQLTDELVADSETRTLCQKLMQEVAVASAACSRPIEQSFIDKMMSNTLQMRPYAPSMKLDFERGNPMELESIYGNPLRAARAKGVAMPETEKLYHQLISIQLD